MNLDRNLVIELVSAVTDQLHYLDAPEQGKFDPGPTMLQRADARVRAAHRAITCPELGGECPEQESQSPEPTSEHLLDSSGHFEQQHDLFGGIP